MLLARSHGIRWRFGTSVLVFGTRTGIGIGSGWDGMACLLLHLHLWKGWMHSHDVKNGVVYLLAWSLALGFGGATEI